MTVSGPLHAASSSSLATPFWKEAAIRTVSRTCGRPASAAAVSGVFVSRMTISAGSIRSGRQSARSGTTHCSPNESTVTVPLRLDRPRVLLAREELHVEPCPGECCAVDGAERPGADDDDALLPEDAHAPLGLEHEPSAVPPASSRRWASAASCESVGGGDARRDEPAPASSRRSLQLRLLARCRCAR